MLRCLWTHSGFLPKFNKFFDYIKDALNLHEKLLTGTVLRGDPRQEQFSSASILKHSLIKFGPVHLELTFTSCLVLKLVLGTSLPNICFSSCLHGSSGRFYKWKSSFSWGLQGQPLWGFSFAVLCVGERFVFPFLFSLSYRFGIAAIGFTPRCQEAGDETSDSQAGAASSANRREPPWMVGKSERRHCHASAEFVVLIPVCIF